MSDTDEDQDVLSESVSRNPNFSLQEVVFLIDQVAKYKNIILNKSTTSSSNQAKDSAWKEITIEFNRQNFEHKRHIDCLRTKWVNIKKKAKTDWQTSKGPINEIYQKIIAIVNEVDLLGPGVGVTFESHNGIFDSNDENSEVWQQNEKPMSSDDLSDGDNSLTQSKNKRSIKFTPRECSLLLQCVRKEKDYVMIKDGSPEVKDKAWMRVTRLFNSRSPQRRRSMKVLKTKFQNMKNIAKTVNFNKPPKPWDKTFHNLCTKPYMELGSKKIKVELDAITEEGNIEVLGDISQDNDIIKVINDPLETVINGGDSGLYSTSLDSPLSENKNADLLQLELLTFKIETAKIERQRLIEAMRTEKTEREAKAIESSLRLRTARLEAIAAENKLPPSHPALKFTAEEKLAQEYLSKDFANQRLKNGEI